MCIYHAPNFQTGIKPKNFNIFTRKHTLEEKQIGIDKITLLKYDIFRNPEQTAGLIENFFYIPDLKKKISPDLKKNIKFIQDLCALGKDLSAYKKELIQPVLTNSEIFKHLIKTPHDLVTCAHHFSDYSKELFRLLEDPKTFSRIIDNLEALITLIQHYPGVSKAEKEKILLKPLLKYPELYNSIIHNYKQAEQLLNFSGSCKEEILNKLSKNPGGFDYIAGNQNESNVLNKATHMSSEKLESLFKATLAKEFSAQGGLCRGAARSESDANNIKKNAPTKPQMSSSSTFFIKSDSPETQTDNRQGLGDDIDKKTDRKGKKRKNSTALLQPSSQANKKPRRGHLQLSASSSSFFPTLQHFTQRKVSEKIGAELNCEGKKTQIHSFQ